MIVNLTIAEVGSGSTKTEPDKNQRNTSSDSFSPRPARSARSLQWTPYRNHTRGRRLQMSWLLTAKSNRKSERR